MSRAALATRIHAWIDASLQGRFPEPFEALALDIHAYQRAFDAVIDASSAPAPSSLADIPAIPVDWFKQFRIGTVRGEPPVCFRTSGTTQGARGEHCLWDTTLYDHGSLAFSTRMLPDQPERTVALLGDPREVPDSSLSHMVAHMSRHASWHTKQGVLDVACLQTELSQITEPIFVASTAFALVDFLQSAPAPLPTGSLLMVTGGFKGHHTHVDEDALIAQAREMLAPARIVSEYGMAELSSQLWGVSGGVLYPPAWLRVIAVDPATGTPVRRGQPGQLRFYDLANLDSSVGIETLDQGILHGDGGLTLLGRLPGAVARGCSLTIEEARVLQAAQKPS